MGFPTVALNGSFFQAIGGPDSGTPYTATFTFPDDFPGAGELFPGQVLEITGIRVSLLTSAVVGQRFCTVTLRDSSAKKIVEGFSPTAATAATAAVPGRTWQFSPGQAEVTLLSLTKTAIPAGMTLQPGPNTLDITIVAPLAGDVLDEVVLYGVVRE